MQRHLYMISGLGADERMFRRLEFPPGYTVHFLPWLKPRQDEPIVDYARRMAEGIDPAHTDITMLGLSFGGIMSQEIARLRPVRKIVLISSIKHSNEKPPYFNWARQLKLHHLPDLVLYRHRHLVVQYFLNVKGKEEKALLKEYLRDRSFDDLRWSVNTVLHWQQQEAAAPVVHIHGAKDLTFPLRFVRPTYTIADGGHFMVLDRAEAISPILGEILAD